MKMMKKIASLLIAFVLIFGMSATAFAAAVKPEIDTKTVAAGSDVNVKITLDETITGVASFEYYLYFDSEIFTLKSSENGTAHEDMMIGKLGTDKKTGENYYTINVIDKESTAEGLTINAGIIYTLTFTAKEDVTEEQTAAFRLVSKGVYTPSFEIIDVPVNEGNIEVTIGPKECEHVWDNGKVTTEPTCVAEGVMTYTCTVEGCGETKTEGIPATNSHSYDEGKVTVAPTCTEKGVMTYTCTAEGCGASYTEAIPVVEHTEENLPAVAPTCTETGLTEGKKCTVCGEVLVAQEVIEALGHKEETVPGKAATCTEAGLTEGKKCSECGETVVAQEEIPALGHTEEVIPGKAATCTEAGLTEGKKCSVCEETLVEQEEIPALGHTDEDNNFYCDVCEEDLCTEHEEEVIPGKNATCTETGLTDGVKCSVCGETLKEQEEIEALGHKEEVVPGKEATCTETGLTEGKECSVCGEDLVAQEEIPALGHTDEDEDNYCDVCDEKLADEPSTEVPDTPEKPEGNKNWWSGIKNFFDKIFGNHGGDDDSDDSTQQPETPDEPTTPEEPEKPEQPEVPDTPEEPEKPNNGFGWIGDIIGNWFGKWWK